VPARFAILRRDNERTGDSPGSTNLCEIP
jgi:hypothetical protein